MTFLHFNCRLVAAFRVVSASNYLLYTFDWGDPEHRRQLKAEWSQIIGTSPGNIVLDFRGLPLHTPSIGMIYELARLPRSCNQEMTVICLPEDEDCCAIHPTHLFRWHFDLDQAVAQLSKSAVARGTGPDPKPSG